MNETRRPLRRPADITTASITPEVTCDLCGSPLNDVERLDAKAWRRVGWPAACTDCLRYTSTPVLLEATCGA